MYPIGMLFETPHPFFSAPPHLLPAPPGNLVFPIMGCFFQ